MSERKNDGGSVHPRVFTDGDGQIDSMGGMSLRDYFAAKAMPVVAEHFSKTDNERNEDWAHWLARNSYAVADSMLRAREAGND